MTTEWNAREVLILEMLAGFGSNVANPTIDAMVRVCLPFQIEAVQQACERFTNKEVDGHDYRFPPNAPQLVDQVRLLDRVLNRIAGRRGTGLIPYRMGESPPEGTVPLGPVKIEVDGRIRDVSHLTHAEKEEILLTGKMPSEEQKSIAPALKRMD